MSPKPPAIGRVATGSAALDGILGGGLPLRSVVMIAGEPGAETTPFPNAGYDCPGDDDLEHVLGVPTGRPLLTLEQLICDDEGRPFDVAYCYSRSDRFGLVTIAVSERLRGAEPHAHRNGTFTMTADLEPAEPASWYGSLEASAVVGAGWEAR